MRWSNVPRLGAHYEKVTLWTCIMYLGKQNVRLNRCGLPGLDDIIGGGGATHDSLYCQLICRLLSHLLFYQSDNLRYSIYYHRRTKPGNIHYLEAGSIFVDGLIL